MGILSDDMKGEREQVVQLLTKAYWMEIETVMNYIANSINPDGVRAQEVIDSLQQDIQEAEQADIVHVIKGVIEAEKGAIDHYNEVIEFCDGKDPVTADMVTTILADEEGHRRLFEGFLKEYEGAGAA